TLRRSMAPISCSNSALSEVTETGVSCRFSLVRLAVVMTSSSANDAVVCAPADTDSATVRPTAACKVLILMIPPYLYIYLQHLINSERRAVGRKRQLSPLTSNWPPHVVAPAPMPAPR